MHIYVKFNFNFPLKAALLCSKVVKFTSAEGWNQTLLFKLKFRLIYKSAQTMEAQLGDRRRNYLENKS